MEDFIYEDDFTDPNGVPRGARILVAEDDPMLRDLVTRRLSSEGYVVREAASGTELVETLQTITVQSWPLDALDLLVLDNFMPGATGLDVMRRLRHAHWETPAILITAFPDDFVRREARTLGIVLLPKPFTLELLSRAVCHALVTGSTGEAS